jgi:hypothetical protein
MQFPFFSSFLLERLATSEESDFARCLEKKKRSKQEMAWFIKSGGLSDAYGLLFFFFSS